MEPLSLVLAWAAIIAAYLLPSIVAKRKHKKRYSQIAALNVLLGWTVMGWIGALIWALGDD